MDSQCPGTASSLIRNAPTRSYFSDSVQCKNALGQWLRRCTEPWEIGISETTQFYEPLYYDSPLHILIGRDEKKILAWGYLSDCIQHIHRTEYWLLATVLVFLTECPSCRKLWFPAAPAAAEWFPSGYSPQTSFTERWRARSILIKVSLKRLLFSGFAEYVDLPNLLLLQSTV